MSNIKIWNWIVNIEDGKGTVHYIRHFEGAWKDLCLYADIKSDEWGAEIDGDICRIIMERTTENTPNKSSHFPPPPPLVDKMNFILARETIKEELWKDSTLKGRHIKAISKIIYDNSPPSCLISSDKCDSISRKIITAIFGDSCSEPTTDKGATQ